jgi:bacteriophage N4 adsorption protein B
MWQENLIELMIFIRPVLIFLAYLTTISFLVSGIGDLILDVYYWVRLLFRKLLSKRWYKLDLDRLYAREQQKIALFVPAWQEADVIYKMCVNAVQNIQYHNYDIFVGTYPNDLDTQAEVLRAAAKYPQIHNVINPEDGPSTKAKNLNNMFAFMEQYEKETGQRYEMIVHHDSEDLIHPLSFLVTNYLIPRKDMVQIPVFPLSKPNRFFTHWTYADEFAENHTKLLVAREYTGGFIPSAGVGTGYSRRSFERLKKVYQGEIFSVNSLTEDYELGLKMNLEGISSAFLVQELNLTEEQKKAFRIHESLDMIATRAMFPTSFQRAVRQKTRWNLGIVLQAWQNNGWKGSPGVIWFLIRDRKPIVTAFTAFLGNFIFLYFVLYSVLNFIYPKNVPILFFKGTLLWDLILAATIFMLWRMLNRMIAVWKIYGLIPAILSIPRVFWGNAINFFAMVRAVYQFLLSDIVGTRLSWDKTKHEFPDIAQDRVLHNKSRVYHSVEELTTSDIIQRQPSIKYKLLNKEPQSRVSGVRSISLQEKDFFIDCLVDMLKTDKSWMVRSEICKTLGFFKDPIAIPALERAAYDPVWTVRTNAVKALIKFDNEGIEKLNKIANNNDLYAKEAAVAILEQYGIINYD